MKLTTCICDMLGTIFLAVSVNSFNHTRCIDKKVPGYKMNNTTGHKVTSKMPFQTLILLRKFRFFPVISTPGTNMFTDSRHHVPRRSTYINFGV
jgi:hypothetical protein